MAEIKQEVLFPAFNSTQIENRQISQVVKKTVGPSPYRQKVEGFQNLNLLNCLFDGNEYKNIFIRAVKDIVIQGKQMIGFSKIHHSLLWNTIVNFYEYDFIIDRFWNAPLKYLPILRNAYAVISPDYSVERSFPDEVNEWSMYRMRTSAYILQSHGIITIPNLPICPQKFYDKLFGCLEQGGIYAVNTFLAFNSFFSKHFLLQFLHNAIDILKPQAFIIYGNPITLDGVKTFFFNSNNNKYLNHGK